MAIKYECDRCGAEQETVESVVSSSFAKNLCEPCFNALIEWLNPLAKKAKP